MTLLSCKQQTTDKREVELKEKYSSEFKIVFDTLDISIDGHLEKVNLFRDNFYGMFETGRENTSQSFKKMIVLNRNGEFVEDVFIPSEIQNMPHYDIIVQNDSLFIKESQFEKINFVLGESVADFKMTKTKELKFYEDESYEIYATCNGEWGGTIYFRDKVTNESFEASSTCPLVINKIDNEYYVTNYMGHAMGFASVIKIAEPKKLEKFNLNFNKEQGSKHNKGVKILIDTVNFHIPTSFVADNELLHLYSDDNGTYIGKIENRKVESVYKFDFTFYAHFSQHLDNGRQLLSYHIKDNEKGGILLIDGKKFLFYQQKR